MKESKPDKKNESDNESLENKCDKMFCEDRVRLEKWQIGKKNYP